MAQRITALALVVGLFEALYDIISRPSQSLHTVAEELKLDTCTRDQFLQSIVKFAHSFLEKERNKQEFNGMLTRAAHAEKLVQDGCVTNSDKIQKDATRPAWIANTLATCSKTTVRKLFDLIYDSPTFSPVWGFHFFMVIECLRLSLKMNSRSLQIGTGLDSY